MARPKKYPDRPAGHINVMEVCNALGVSRATLYRYREANDFPRPVRAEGQAWFDQAAIRTWAERRAGRQVVAYGGVYMILDDLLRRIDQKKAILDARRPLPAATVRSIQAAVWLELTYNSNALEGNTLTLRETQVVLEGLTIGSGRTMREHLEVINHAAALEMLEDLVDRKEGLSPFVARQLHALILRGIDDANAGRERQVPVAISGSRHLPPPPHEVGPMLSDLFTWHRTTAMQLHPVQRAAAMHHRFVYIHPFTDGNGRTARLLMNLDLMTSGYPPAIIRAEPKRRIDYLDSLEAASVEGNLGPFEQVVAEAVEESLDRYLSWTDPAPRAQ